MEKRLTDQALSLNSRLSKRNVCVSRQAVRRKHMEDVAAVKKLHSRKRTHANAVTFHYTPAVSRQPLTVCLPPSVSVLYLVSGHRNKLAGCGWWPTPPSWPNFSVSQQTGAHSHTRISQLQSGSCRCAGLAGKNEGADSTWGYGFYTTAWRQMYSMWEWECVFPR